MVGLGLYKIILADVLYICMIGQLDYTYLNLQQLSCFLQGGEGQNNVNFSPNHYEMQA